ncbi:MAG: T9SS type A sorting domain-containing protein, partial [Aliifodinibius sp.]|nr:T9SS type A sorting domain-containing protein [Fodinibius sp.]NIV12163.1 T9SS type A sorting domain-containing protein [Fodinibius sp.]NIY25813.1 T9SS type A sorting domain-containing protein [Fodinibius sp.]
GGIGYPLAIGDFNNNGKLDFAGAYRIPIDAELAQAAIAELQLDSSFLVKKIYQDTVIIPLAATDVNSNNLRELNITDPLLTVSGKAFANYEQSHPDSFPNIRQFTHRTWEVSGEVSREVFTDLDQDGFREVLYKGDDSLQPNSHQIFVAEYKPASRTMERVFGYVPSPDWRTSRFSVGDFDADGFLEFATGSVTGYVYVVENIGDDSYQPTYQDTVSTPNAYLTAPTDDIDGNGKTEFFLGGSAFYNGVPATRIYWFEADGNNNYIKKRSFFLLGTDVLGFDVLYTYDINSDGIDDLVCSFSFSVVMLIWNNSTQEFDLFYYDIWENYDQEINSITMYDAFNTGYLDLFVSVTDIANPPRIKSFYYKSNHVTGVEIPSNAPGDFHLAQNYPNPFNLTTIIRYELPLSMNIELSVYDILGRMVKKLVNKYQQAGTHKLPFDASGLSSAVYIYQLKTGKKVLRKKMFLMH